MTNSLLFDIFLFQGRMTRSTSSSAGFTNGNGNSTSEYRNSTNENRNSTSENRNSTSENNGHCSSSLSNDIEPTHGMCIKWMNTGIPRLVRFFGPQQTALLEKPGLI